MNSWKVGEAKQRFSELLRAATREPQGVFNRDRLVAVVIDADTHEAFQAWRAKQREGSLAEAFRQLRQLLLEERYTLKLPRRRDRLNRFTSVLDDLSL